MSRRNPKPATRNSTVTIPTGVSPHVKLMFAEMQRQGVIYDDLEEGSGVLKTTFKAWRHKNRPSLDSLEAALGFLGWDFVPVPRSKKLPPEVVKLLTPAAEAAGLTMPAAVRALIEIVADIHVDLKTARAPKVKPEAVPKRRRGDPHPDQVGLFGEAPTVH